MADDRDGIDSEPPITAAWLALQGVPGTSEELKQFEEKIASVLEMRIGRELFSVMTNEQLDEFEKLNDTDDEEAKMDYLEKVVPKYQSTVYDERAKLAQELAQASDKRAFIENL